MFDIPMIFSKGSLFSLEEFWLALVAEREISPFRSSSEFESEVYSGASIHQHGYFSCKSSWCFRGLLSLVGLRISWLARLLWISTFKVMWAPLDVLIKSLKKFRKWCVFLFSIEYLSPICLTLLISIVRTMLKKIFFYLEPFFLLNRFKKSPSD